MFGFERDSFWISHDFKTQTVAILVLFTNNKCFIIRRKHFSDNCSFTSKIKIIFNFHPDPLKLQNIAKISYLSLQSLNEFCHYLRDKEMHFRVKISMNYRWRRLFYTILYSPLSYDWKVSWFINLNKINNPWFCFIAKVN